MLNIPAGCSACDILTTRRYRGAHGREELFSVPFFFCYLLHTPGSCASEQYVVHHKRRRRLSSLNAGQFTELNNVSGARAYRRDKPVSVIQYMQGKTVVPAARSIHDVRVNSEMIRKSTG